eukprot:gb/GECH01003479.1/.p1 GENE.gb/GECH01003479.1/~~gb/GECH01003479.1/.p1  ORF type:complete len:143 (+),score=39.72 gb/GECH01003479.1/:1-429(+)
MNSSSNIKNNDSNDMKNSTDEKMYDSDNSSKEESLTHFLQSLPSYNKDNFSNIKGPSKNMRHQPMLYTPKHQYSKPPSNQVISTEKISILEKHFRNAQLQKQHSTPSKRNKRKASEAFSAEQLSFGRSSKQHRRNGDESSHH